MWNYRVVKFKEEETEEEFLEIREVYYDTIGKPLGHCSATAGGNSLQEIKNALSLMALALDKPIITFKTPHE